MRLRLVGELRRRVRGDVQRVRRGGRVRWCGILGVVGRLVKDRVHLLVKTEDGDVRRRGDLLWTRRLWGQLLMTNVLCLLRWTVCHVCEASAQCRNTDKGGDGVINSRAYTQTLVAEGLAALAERRHAKGFATGAEVVSWSCCEGGAGR